MISGAERIQKSKLTRRGEPNLVSVAWPDYGFSTRHMHGEGPRRIAQSSTTFSSISDYRQIYYPRHGKQGSAMEISECAFY